MRALLREALWAHRTLPLAISGLLLGLAQAEPWFDESGPFA